MAAAKLTELHLGLRVANKNANRYLLLAAERGITNLIPEKRCKHWALGSMGETKYYLVGQI